MNNKEIKISTKTVISPIEISEGNLKAESFETELKSFFPKEINQKAKRQFFLGVSTEDVKNLNTSHIPFLFHLTNQLSLEKRRKSREQKNPEKKAISFAVELSNSLFYLEKRFVNYIIDMFKLFDSRSICKTKAVSESEKKRCSPVLCITKLEPIVNNTSSYLCSLKHGSESDELTAEGMLSPEECLFINSSQKLRKLFLFITNHYATTDQEKEIIRKFKPYLLLWRDIENSLKTVERLERLERLQAKNFSILYE